MKNEFSLLYRKDGVTEQLLPNQQILSFGEIKAALAGISEGYVLPDGSYLFIKGNWFTQLPINRKASEMYGDKIFGDAIHCSSKYFETTLNEEQKKLKEVFRLQAKPFPFAIEKQEERYYNSALFSKFLEILLMKSYNESYMMVSEQLQIDYQKEQQKLMSYTFGDKFTYAGILPLAVADDFTDNGLDSIQYFMSFNYPEIFNTDTIELAQSKLLYHLVDVEMKVSYLSNGIDDNKIFFYEDKNGTLGIIGFWMNAPDLEPYIEKRLRTLESQYGGRPLVK